MDLDKLEKLVRLRDAGILTEQEFEEQKAAALNLTPASSTNAPPTPDIAEHISEKAYEIAPPRNIRLLVALGIVAALICGGVVWSLVKGGSGSKSDMVHMVVTEPANARDRPTTTGSSIVTQYGPNTKLEGRWVEGVSKSSERWLEIEYSGKKLYIWSGNLSASGLNLTQNVAAKKESKEIPKNPSEDWISGSWVLVPKGGEDGLTKCEDFSAPVIYSMNDKTAKIITFYNNGDYRSLFNYTTPSEEEHYQPVTAHWQLQNSQIILRDTFIDDPFGGQVDEPFFLNISRNGDNVLMIDEAGDGNSHRFVRCTGSVDQIYGD